MLVAAKALLESPFVLFLIVLLVAACVVAANQKR